MESALTEKYALSSRKGLSKPFLLLRDAYRHEKLRELGSFVVWEISHRLGLFPKEQYLRFGNDHALRLGSQELDTPAFSESVCRFFADKEMRVSQCDQNWKLLFLADDGTAFGCVYPDDKNLYKSTDHGQTIGLVKRFEKSVKSVFLTSRGTMLVCVRGAVYRSADGGASFAKSLELASPESFFRHNNGMTETPGKLLALGEYGNVWSGKRWANLANVYFSSDDGETWARSGFLQQEGTNKHVHLVRYSPALDRLLLADGDNKKKLWVSGPLDSFDVHDPSWIPVTKSHIQMGGYTSLAEHEGTLLFGTDYQGGTNFIVKSADCQRFERMVVPDPYRRSPIDNLVQRRSYKGDEIWADLPYSTPGTKSLLMYTTDGGQSWTKAIEYNRATHCVWLLNSSRGIADELYFAVEDLVKKRRVVYRVADSLG